METEMTSFGEGSANKRILSSNREKILEELCLFDDKFFEIVMSNSRECVEEILQIIMDDPQLKVDDHAFSTQHKITTVVGHKAIFDLYVMTDDSLYDLEVQRKRAGTSPKRTRYYSSIADTDLLGEGEDYDTIKDSYVIFITESGYIGDKKMEGPIYHIQSKIVEEDNSNFDDGRFIIYVNGAYDGDEKLENFIKLKQLMHDFRCTNPDDISSGKLRDRIKYLKRTEGGKEEMSNAFEVLVEEGREEGRKEIILMMIDSGLTPEKIAFILKRTVQDIKKIIEEDE